MEAEKKAALLSFALSATAGFCDALTYVAAGGLFSAHVTGNFILFATNLANTTGHDPWIKLLTFPVFIFSVILGGWIGEKSGDRYRLLLLEGVLLSGAGILSIYSSHSGWLADNWLLYLLAMIIVFARGLQNAFGKLFPKETYGPTTMMTGNVTQWAIDVKTMWLPPVTYSVASGSFKKLSITIVGFLMGCLAGATAGKFIGPSSVLFAGTALLICYALSRK